MCVNDWCCRASDALDCAAARVHHPVPPSSSMGQPGNNSAHVISYLEEQLRQATAEVAEIEERLL